MKKKLQVAISEEAWLILDGLVKQANEDFSLGSVGFSDAVNEMILSNKVDVKVLQNKNINFRKSLRVLASQKDLDISAAIKTLQDLKSKAVKTSPKPEIKEVT